MPAFMSSFLVGLLAWTLAEYGIHRWMGHARCGRLRVTAQHRCHHRTEGWFAPPLPKAFLVLRVLVAVGGLGAGFGLVVGAPGATGLGLATGFGLGFFVYEGIHWRLHAMAPSSALGARLRRHHFAHHNGLARANFGVTNRFWDWAFGTLVSEDPVRVSGSRAPSWLLDPATGEVQAAFVSSYALRGRPRPSSESPEPNGAEAG